MIHDGLHARAVRLLDAGHSEVHALVERPTVDPLLAGMPSLNRGRIQKLLSHHRGCLRELGEPRLGEAEVAGELDRAGDELRGALHPLELRLLEPVRVEDGPEDRPNLAVRLEVGVHHLLDGPRVLGRLDAPCGDLGLVGHEEVVEVAADEPGRGLLPHDDVDDVLAVEVALVAEEGLLAVVVILGVVHELGLVVAEGVQRDGLLEGPAREGPGRLLDVELGVGADAHGEQLEQLPAVVLVDAVGVVLPVVQPVDHGWILGEVEEDIPHLAQAVAPKGVDLSNQRRCVLALVVRGGEDVMPEEGHLLL